MQSLLNAPIYGLVDNDKLSKFGNILKFKYVTDSVGVDGNVYKIYNRSI